MRVGYPSWSVEVSEEWSVTEHPECLTLELSDQGALQGSSATKKGGNVTREELFFSKEQRKNWGAHKDCSLGDFTGIAYSYEEDDMTWYRWFLRSAATILFFTYNGSHQAAAEESSQVAQVLRTLKAEHSLGA